jgi:hypothetical protein
LVYPANVYRGDLFPRPPIKDELPQDTVVTLVDSLMALVAEDNNILREELNVTRSEFLFVNDRPIEVVTFMVSMKSPVGVSAFLARLLCDRNAEVCCESSAGLLLIDTVPILPLVYFVSPVFQAHFQ